MIRGENLLDAVFMDNTGHPRYEVVEYTKYINGRRGKTMQWILYSKGPGVRGEEDYSGTPLDEDSRSISLDEARAWVQARLDAGNVREIAAREALEFLDEWRHAEQAMVAKGR